MMEGNTVRVWDIAVRLFHWSLASLFLFSYLSGEEDSTLHVYSGYAIIGLLVFRVIWGFVGSKYARFSNFLYAFGTVSSYMRSLLAGKPAHYTGHTPAGGWMIMALLGSLALTTATGLKTYGEEGHGPLADIRPAISLVSSARASGREYEYSELKYEDENHDEDEEMWEELHEFFANLTLLLILVHISAVLVTSILHRDNLVRAMITGKKTRQ